MNGGVAGLSGIDWMSQTHCCSIDGIVTVTYESNPERAHKTHVPQKGKGETGNVFR